MLRRIWAILPALLLYGACAHAQVPGGSGAQVVGTLTVGNCVKAAGSKSIEDAGAVCGSGGGGTPGGSSGDIQYNNAGSFGGVTLVPVANGGTGLASGTSGGVLAYTASGTLASSGALTANLPVIGGGAGVAPGVGTRSGNTTAFVTTTGAQTSGDCVSIDASGNHIAAGAPCGSGGSGLTVGTTTIASGTDKGLLYDNAGVLGNLASGNNGVLITGGTGIPSISSTLPSGIAATNMALTTPAIGAASGTSVNLSGSATASSFLNTGTTYTFQSGGTTGSLVWAPASSGKTITLPNGTTDFTGTSGLVQQASAGAAFTVSASLPIGTTGTNTALTTPTLSDAINQSFHVSTADKSFTSDTALADITGLSQVLTAGATYSCRVDLIMTNGTTGGYKVSLIGSGGLTSTYGAYTLIRYNSTGIQSTIGQATFTTTLPNTITSSTGHVLVGISIVFSLVVDVGGTLSIQAAQNTSNSTPTTFYRGSQFSCVRVS